MATGITLRAAGSDLAKGRHLGRGVVRVLQGTLLVCSFLAFAAERVDGAAGPEMLVGTFKIAAGSCNASGTSVTGSYFRVAFPGGSVSSGPFFQNAGSSCPNQSYTLVQPGTRGLVTGSFQPDPIPAFDTNGDAKASAIIKPVSFTGVDLSLSTNPTDLQTGLGVPSPSIIDDNGKLSGQTEAISAAWNKIFLNQGSPKPGGRLTAHGAVRGTYDPSTRAFSLSWASEVNGGRFSHFIWFWHLEGTFWRPGQKPAPAPPATPQPLPAAPTGLASNVGLFNCGPQSGGLRAGGIALNKTAQTATYHITVGFYSEAGTVLTTGSTLLSIPPNASNLWSAYVEFSPPRGKIRCQVTAVTAS